MECDYPPPGFVSSPSLILELAGSNLVPTLLNPPKVQWDQSFLSGGSIVFTNEINDLVLWGRFQTSITQLTKSNIE